MKVNEYEVMLKENEIPYLLKTRCCECLDCVSEKEEAVSLIENAYRASNLAEEFLFLVALNAKLKPLALFRVSQGTNRNVIAGTREIFLRLLASGADSGVILHNHPSGDPTPSKEDIEVTTQLIDSGKLLRIPIFDHIVVARQGYRSIRDITKNTLEWV